MKRSNLFFSLFVAALVFKVISQRRDVVGEVTTVVAIATCAAAQTEASTETTIRTPT